MKTAIAILMLTGLLQAQSVSINPITLAKGFSKATKMHKAIFAMEALTAAISLGADGGSTEYVNAHSNLYYSPCGCYYRAAHETNPLFINQGTGNLNQYKFWSYKIGIAAAPFAISWLAHRGHKDSPTVDGLLIVGLGFGDYTFLRAAISNLNIAATIKRENKAAGNPVAPLYSGARLGLPLN
jgi:hypothetical protein